MKKMLLILTLVTSLFILSACKDNTPDPDPEPDPDPIVIDFSEVYPNSGTYYQLFVRSFADSDGDGVGDFNGITEKLDYLKDLGVNALWLMPIHPSPSYHGYDVADYYAVNSEYGTMEDFENLLDVSEEMGIDIIIDFVINHTSSQHPWFQAWQAGDAEYAGYYRKITSGDIRLDQSGAWGQDIWHTMSGGYYCGYFGGNMPDLNWSNPVVQNIMVDIAKYWIEKGVDGFRLDAALHLEGVGEVKAPTIPIDSTLTKLELFEYQIESEYPDIYIIGEIYDAFSVSSLFYQSMDSALNFDIGGDILGAITAGFSTNYSSTIVRNNGIISDYERGGMDAPFLRNHDQDRIASVLNGNPIKLKLAAEMLLSLPGNPFIYYGEELGMFGIKSTGPYWDETRRLPLPFGDEYETSWFPDEFNTNLQNVEEQLTNPASLLNVYRAMLAVRNNSNALKYGDVFTYEEASNVLLGYYRVFNYDEDNQEIVLVLHNVSNGEYQLYFGDEEVLYYSEGIDNFNGSMGAKTTLIIRISNEMMGAFYEEE